jgi:hypothetical protein
MEIGKTSKHYNNYGHDNQNVHMCGVKKKKEQTITTLEATTQTQKVQNNGSYASHICGLIGHKMTYCPKFAMVQKIFQGKNASTLDGKVVANVKTITTNVNVVYANVATKSKIIEEQVF